VALPGITDMRWLLTRWAQQLGVESPSSEPATALAQIYEQLAIAREDGRNAVLIVDEAQVIAERGFLAELRGLLNLEYEDKRLVTLVLVGTPKLAEAIAAEPALADRVNLRLSIPPLQTKEVEGYLHHRIRAAGGNPAIFESSAVKAVTRLCGGIPRRINELADNALFEAHLAGRVSATAADVERAAASLEVEPAAEAPPVPDAVAPARADVSAGARVERSAALQAAPAPRRRDAPAAEPLFGDEPEVELGEVFAEPNHRRAAVTMLIPEIEPISASEDEGEYAVGQSSGRELRLDDSGELEDLFADIVDE
jgi:hypothetical protein